MKDTLIQRPGNFLFLLVGTTCLSVYLQHLINQLINYFFMATLQHMEVPGPGIGSEPSCGNAGSFNPPHWAGDQTCAFTAT